MTTFASLLADFQANFAPKQPSAFLIEQDATLEEMQAIAGRLLADSQPLDHYAGPERRSYRAMRKEGA